MKILILGGTQFVGRAITQAALDNGHTVSLFTRGQTNPDLFPDVEKLIGDRDGQLDALSGQQWDAAIDVSGYLPRIVRQSLAILADAVDHLTFVSSVSVYDRAIYDTPNMDETGPLARVDDLEADAYTPETYGGLKVACEELCEETMPGRVFIPRPGLVAGPHDHTERFTYWPVNIARRERMMAPPADTLAQYIDSRDLAEWIVRMVESGQVGAYNALGPAGGLRFGDMLEACARAVGDDAAQIIHADEDFLTAHEVRPWSDFPLWLPTAYSGMARVNVDKAGRRRVDLPQRRRHRPGYAGVGPRNQRPGEYDQRRPARRSSRRPAGGVAGRKRRLNQKTRRAVQARRVCIVFDRVMTLRRQPAAPGRRRPPASR